MKRLIPTSKQNRKSFYGKAHYDENETSIDLYSYGTHVARYDRINGVLIVYSYMSQTTTEHIVAFANLVFGNVENLDDYEKLLKDRPELFG